MRSTSALAVVCATETDRTDDRSTEQLFGSVLSDVAKLLWPKNTAAYLAVGAACDVRTAEMYLGGQRKWSGDALAFIVAEIMRRHGTRNIKVRSKD